MKKIKLYKGKIIIHFEGNEDKHWFTYPDGKKIPSVTSYTREIDKSDAIAGWAVKMMALYLQQNWDIKKVKDELERDTLIQEAKRKFRQVKIEAAQKGKEAHSWADQYVKYHKGKADKPKEPEDIQVKNAVSAFLDWIEKSGIKIQETERIVFSRKFGYAGIADWVGTKKGVPIIGDHKTSAGIYRDMPFQLMLYWNALEEETKVKYQEGHIVQFGKETAEFKEFIIPRKRYLELRDSVLGLVAFLPGLKSVEQELNTLFPRNYGTTNGN